MHGNLRLWPWYFIKPLIRQSSIVLEVDLVIGVFRSLVKRKVLYLKG